MLTPQQSRRYFERRLSGQRFTGHGAEQKTRCPFHDDRTPSFSANSRRVHGAVMRVVAVAVSSISKRKFPNATATRPEGTSPKSSAKTSLRGAASNLWPCIGTTIHRVS